MGGHHSAGGSFPMEDVTTIFVVGFPQDMKEREFANMFTFSAGFQGATLKLASPEEKDPQRKQAIGFAKFRSRFEAERACLHLTGHKAERNHMLKAEMARKNLFISAEAQMEAQLNREHRETLLRALASGNSSSNNNTFAEAAMSPHNMQQQRSPTCMPLTPRATPTKLAIGTGMSTGANIQQQHQQQQQPKTPQTPMMSRRSLNDIQGTAAIAGLGLHMGPVDWSSPTTNSSQHAPGRRVSMLTLAQHASPASPTENKTKSLEQPQQPYTFVDRESTCSTVLAQQHLQLMPREMQPANWAGEDDPMGTNDKLQSLMAGADDETSYKTASTIPMTYPGTIPKLQAGDNGAAAHKSVLNWLQVTAEHTITKNEENAQLDNMRAQFASSSHSKGLQNLEGVSQISNINSSLPMSSGNTKLSHKRRSFESNPEDDLVLPKFGESEVDSNKSSELDAMFSHMAIQHNRRKSAISKPSSSTPSTPRRIVSDAELLKFYKSAEDDVDFIYDNRRFSLF